MKSINLITLLLAAIGAINWGLVAVADFNLVSAIFGASVVAKVIYILVGVSGVYQLTKVVECCK